MLRGTPVRVLDDRELDAVRDLLDRDPVANVFVSSRIESAGLDPWRLGAEVWGFVAGGRLAALCYAGANLVPVGASADACRGFADKARRQGRRCSSIVGPRDQVSLLWSLLEPTWGPARDVRPHQPLMAISDAPRIAPDPLVRRVRPDELDILYPACVAMFTEEVGISPSNGDGGSLYRARVGELISQGRAFARIEDGRVVFKAEVRRRHAGGLPDPRRVGRPRLAWSRLRQRRHGSSRRAGPGDRGASRQPLRERLQHRGSSGVHPRRLHRGRRLHVGALLARQIGSTT